MGGSHIWVNLKVHDRLILVILDFAVIGLLLLHNDVSVMWITLCSMYCSVREEKEKGRE